MNTGAQLPIFQQNSPIKPLTRRRGTGIIKYMDSNPFGLIGSYAIWECNHCTEQRVYGNTSPEPDRRQALIRCQVTQRNELHTFIEISGEWVGKECPLGDMPMGGLS